MDPNATLRDIGELLKQERTALNREDLDWACAVLRDWLDRGGFEPTWSDHPRAARYFRLWGDGAFA